MNYGDFLKKSATGLPAAGRVVRVPPSAWADHREDKPVSDVEIGLRLPSENDIQAAREEAVKVLARYPEKAHEEEKILAFNDALMRHMIASSTCHPLNRLEHWFSLGADEIEVRMTTAGIQRLWNELEAFQIADSPAMPEAGDEQFEHLIAMWSRGVGFDFMPPEEARKVKRLIEYARQQLAEAEMKAEGQGAALVAG
jgi:hypothetical protein